MGEFKKKPITTSRGFLSRAFSSAGYVYLSNLITAISGIFIPILLIRNLSPESFGTYKLIHSLLFVAAAVTSFGIEAVMGRFIPEFLTKKDFHSVVKLFRWALLVRVIIVGLFFLIFWQWRSPIAYFFQIPVLVISYLIPILSIILLNLVNRVIGPAWLNPFFEQRLISYNTMLFDVLRVVTFTVALFQGWGIKGIIFAWLFCESVSFVYYSIVSVYGIPVFSYCKTEKKQKAVLKVSRYIKYGLYYFMTGNLIIFHNMMIDNLILSKYLGVSKVGVYGLVCTLVGITVMLDPVKLLKSVIHTIIVSRHTEQPDNEQVIINSYEFLNKIGLILVIPGIFGIILLSDKIIEYIFKQPLYLSGIPALVTLLLFSIFSSLLGPLGQLIGVLEKNKIQLLGIISSLYNLGMDLVLVRIWGVTGIAFATGSALMLQYFLYFYILKQYVSGLILPVRVTFLLTVNCIPMLLFLWLIRPMIKGIPSLLIVIGLGGTIYVITSLYRSVFNEEETRILKENIGKKLIMRLPEKLRFSGG